ncbi:PucR family transcriptional regulator [Anaerotalea alkaliphila]|uniref:PucR family transcriptional regulator n=1 Tax=Anaerotalea alkaliphila TaxID=2662126 RepID=A0A7X5KML5_9FIRM|nr:helix-turn-helix domain-containing protein [Anaerotalea alkaliphila]NDL67079.1 hypothetical protein [Anaerotalea alkaliphila]
MQEMDRDRTYQTMFNALLAGGMETIARAAHGVVLKPIIIVDAEYNLLAQVPERPIGDLIFDTLLENRQIPQEMVRRFKEERYLERVNGCGRAMYVDWGMVQGLPRIMSNFKVCGTVEGYIGILYPEGGFQETHLEFADLLCSTVGLELQKQNNFRVSRHSLQTAFLKDLFQGKIRDRAALEKWLPQVCVDLQKRWCVAAAMQLSSSHEEALLKYIRKRLDECCRNVHSIVIGDTIYILFSGIPQGATYGDVVERCMVSARGILEQFGMAIGMGEVFDDLLELEKHRYQAREALRMGRAMDGGEPVYKYRDYVVSSIFSNARRNMPEENHVHPAVRLLEAFDRENNTEYGHTLRVYVTCLCNSAKAIGKLNIHRNTLLYRLHKIERITGVDLDDTMTCTHLLCNFHMDAGKE